MNAEFQFELHGREGATHEIGVSTNCSARTPWLTTNTSGTVMLSDPASAPAGHRFYRALSQRGGADHFGSCERRADLGGEFRVCAKAPCYP